MKRTAVESSIIKSIGYDLRGGVMEVEFTDGSIYQYEDVPSEAYKGILEASSVGSFFNTRIKGRFGHHRVL